MKKNQLLCAFVSLLSVTSVFADDLYVGSNAPNVTTVIHDSGNLYDNTYVGYTTNAFNNHLDISDLGASHAILENAQDVYIGQEGSSNSMVISNGGALISGVVSAGIGGLGSTIGLLPTASSNSVHVTGSNSYWNNGNNLNIGNAGSFNSLTISNGGSVTNQFGYLAITPESSNNHVTITGTNSIWNNQSNVIIGYGGASNTLIVSNGGQLKSSFGVIGAESSSSNNSVTLTGAGTAWTNQHDITVGLGAPSNSLILSNGATITSQNTLVGGTPTSSNNSVTVTGTNSIWDNTGLLEGNGNFAIGEFGSGNTLTISNGGNITDTESYIGHKGTSYSNSVLVTGDTSSWTHGTHLYVGYEGSNNTMVISNGATVHDLLGTIGYETASNAVVVTGTNSRWENSLDVTLGALGSGNTLIISNGGRVVDRLGFVGVDQYSSNNVVQITGSDSLWGNESNIAIGVAGLLNSMVISNGGTVFNQSGIVGGTNTSLGNFVQVTGTNSQWINSNSLTIGDAGSFNSMVISNGGTVVSEIASLGYNMGSSNNSVTITGTNSTWSNNGNLFVGNEGTSSLLVISNGGRLLGRLSSLGQGVDSLSNSALITGQGSLWSNSSMLDVGYYGNGTLVVADGGTLVAAGSSIGYQFTASNNIVQITGTNSTWSNSGALYVGNRGSYNSLIISDGGTVFNENAAIGQSVGSISNNVLVTGEGSLWSNTGFLDIGSSGSGALVIASGGTVVSEGGSIGYQSSSSNNSVEITGINSLWSNNGNLYVGSQGASNTLIVSGGGKVLNSSNVYIGTDTNSVNNSVQVTGTDSLWSNGGTLTVGDFGNGTLLIGGGATVVSKSGRIGSELTSSSNVVVVTGANSTWSNNGHFYLGGEGSSNTMIIANGGTVANNSNSYISLSTNAANNLVRVAGTGSLWSNGGSLNVGYAGSGGLIISDGATVINGIGRIGNRSTSSNSFVEVIGENSTWDNKGNLYVGNDGSSNLLLISDGGTLKSASNSYIGRDSNSLGNLVRVTGQNSLWSNRGTLNIGYEGNGALVVSDGATVINRSGRIGSQETSSNNLVTVTGNNSLWSNNSYLLVGGTGSSNQMIISEGGKVVNAAGLIGAAIISSNNLVTVTGNQSLWNNSGNLAVGSLGSGNAMLISDKGTVVNEAGFIGAGAASSNNLVTVTGNNSLWYNNGDLIVGSQASGNSMIISNGGMVANNNGYISYQSGTSNNVQVTGISSLWNNNGNLYVGYGGDGILTLRDGGRVMASNIIIGDVAQGGKGILNGSGVINGNVLNNGTFLPSVDDTPGTLVVNGNFVQSSEGRLTIQAINPNNYGQVVVNGTATLGGALEVISVPGKTIPYGGKYNVISSTGSMKGMFDSIVIDQVGARPRFTIVGDPVGELLIAPTSYTLVAQNQNQINEATALNTFIPATSGDELTVATALDELTTSQYQTAFNAISPALYTSMATIAFNNAVAQYNEMIQRLGNIRVAGIGFSSMGFTDSPIMNDNKNVKRGEKDVLVPSVDNHWGIFVDGNGIFANVNIHNQLPGYSVESGGVTFGADYKWNETFSTGIYAGYQGSQSKQSGGNFICDNGSRFGVFGTYQKGGLFANAIVGGDSHSYQVNRSIQFPGINRTATSAPTAGELDSMLAGGYDMKRGNFTFGPITSLQYTYFGMQPFTETGAQSLDLSVANANANSLVYSLGGHCFYTWEASKNILVVPQINLGWQHEFLQNPYALNSTFGNGANFDYMSTTPQRDSLYTGVGFSVTFGKKYDASFFYNASACNPSLVSQNFFASLGMRF